MQCLAQDIRRKKAYRVRTAYLASLAFGKQAALQKIRRIFVGTRGLTKAVTTDV